MTLTADLGTQLGNFPWGCRSTRTVQKAPRVLKFTHLLATSSSHKQLADLGYTDKLLTETKLHGAAAPHPKHPETKLLVRVPEPLRNWPPCRHLPHPPLHLCPRLKGDRPPFARRWTPLKRVCPWLDERP